VDIAEGDRFFLANRIIPDLTFRNSVGDPTATMTIKARRFPGAPYHESDGGDVVQTATVPIEQFTNQKHIRLRGRSMALRVESNQENVSWRLGVPRIDLRTDGKR